MINKTMVKRIIAFCYCIPTLINAWQVTWKELKKIYNEQTMKELEKIEEEKRRI